MAELQKPAHDRSAFNWRTAWPLSAESGHDREGRVTSPVAKAIAHEQMVFSLPSLSQYIDCGESMNDAQLATLASAATSALLHVASQENAAASARAPRQIIRNDQYLRYSASDSQLAMYESYKSMSAMRL